MSYKLKTTYPSLQTRGITICILFLSFGFSGWASDTIFQRLPDPRLWDTAYMVKVFTDHFDGRALDTSVWHVEDCAGRGNIPSNNEGSLNNIEVSKGTLKLIARFDPQNMDTTCWSGGFISNYTTAEIYSIKNRYLYGSYEALCKMPSGKGLFFAYWLWGKGDASGNPKDEWASEIDIAEKINNGVINAFHYWPPEGPEIAIKKGVNRMKKYPVEWHLYKVIWTPYMVEFYVDGKKTWEKSKYYIRRDSKRKSVHLQQIQPGFLYQAHDWFPRHGCGTVFQMQLNNEIAGHEQKLLPAAVEVDFVMVKQFFTAPEITCPGIVTSSATVTLDIDPRASGISWRLYPAEYFSGDTEGTGTTANFKASGDQEGQAKIVWTFQMPSGENFMTHKEFWVGVD